MAISDPDRTAAGRLCLCLLPGIDSTVNRVLTRSWWHFSAWYRLAFVWHWFVCDHILESIREIASLVVSSCVL